jgi:hypothetical protein
MPKTDIVVQLIGENGNAFAILGRVKNALKKGGRSDLVSEFITEATSGDYDHLLSTVTDYVEIADPDEQEDENEFVFDEKG